SVVHGVKEPYRQQQNRELHLKRASEAKKLAVAIRSFLRNRSLDQSLSGIGNGYKVIHNSLINRDRELLNGPCRPLLDRLDDLATGKPLDPQDRPYPSVQTNSLILYHGLAL